MNRLPTPIRTSSIPIRTSSHPNSTPIRTSYRMAIRLAIFVLGLTTGPAFAADTTITRTCNPSGGGYNCYTTISRPPPPIEPAPLRGPITSEEVIIPPKANGGSTAAAPLLSIQHNQNNFCGTGYRMTPDGCAPN